MENNGERPRHSIQLVARRTGLTPAVIRAWERRYGAIRPTRTATRRRLYSDEDIDKLRLLRRATLAGRRIGSIANLGLEQLELLIDEDDAASRLVPMAPDSAASPTTRGHLEACLEAIQSFERRRLDQALKRASLELGTLELMDDLLIPLLKAVGERWSAGSLRIYEEHLATDVVRSQLETLRDSGGDAGGPAVVITTPSGQRHELGAMMAAVTAAARGWRVLYLGPDLPADETASAALRSNARAVAVSVVYPIRDPRVVKELATLRTLLPSTVTLFVGGCAAESHRADLAKLAVVMPGSLQAFRDALDALHAS